MIVFENDRWLIDRVVVGELMVNCYLVKAKLTGELMIVDPGDEPDRILRRAKEIGGRISAILCTHGHADHIGGNARIKELTQAPLIIGRDDAPMLTDDWLNLSKPFGFSVVSPPADRLLDEGEPFEFGGYPFQVVVIPGHTTGEICLIGNGFTLVGDVIFEGSVGRTDFPGGSMESLIEGIMSKLLILPDEMLLLPGHGELTTVGVERRSNPFLTR